MTDLATRMKEYESVSQLHLMRRTPIICRLDGKCFGTWTRGAEKPFAWPIVRTMQAATVKTVKAMQNTKLAYVQSDEVSFLLTDTDTLETQQWFAGNLQKIISVLASTFTAYFNSLWAVDPDDPKHTDRLAIFDARVFSLPPEEVTNYFLWRVRDCRRNSILALAAAHLSPRVMHGKKTDELCSMLAEKDVIWEELEPELRFGKMLIRGEIEAVPDAANYSAVDFIVCAAMEGACSV